MPNRNRATTATATADAPPRFTGFGPEALLFYEGLEADNSKPYWQDHLPDYERAVRGPMAALVTALEPEFGAFKFFRPHRDVRFSKDKSPYKTHAGAATRGPAAYYVQLGADGLLVACGTYRMERDQLERYRAAVADERAGAELASLVEGLTADGHGLMGDLLVRVPRGADPGHPRAELLRRKSLAAFADHGPADWVWTAECLDRVAASFRRLTPLHDWLATHVGPHEPSEGDVRVRR